MVRNQCRPESVLMHADAALRAALLVDSWLRRNENITMIHSYVGSFLLTTGNAKPFKIADLTNPILQPWVVEEMRKANDEVLAGKVGFTARSRCWPHGVPGFLLYPVHPIFFIQTSNQVVMTWGQDFQLRHVYLNVPHSASPKPSWYGESVSAA